MRIWDWRLVELAELCLGYEGRASPMVVRTDYLTGIDIDVLHRHLDFLALMIVRRGRGRHILNGVEYGISRGDVYLMGEGTGHQWSHFDDLIVDTVYFSPKVFDTPTLTALREASVFLSSFLQETSSDASVGIGGKRWLHLTPDEHERIEADVAELHDAWILQTPLSALLAPALFLRLLVHFVTLSHKRQEHSRGIEASPTVSHETSVAAALRLMDARFTEKLSVEEVAAAVYLSPSRFREVFALVMGRTPLDYLRYLRVERAKTLLATTDQPITRIGLASGLGEPAYFSRVFRAETGMTPRAYRQTNLSVSQSHTDISQ